MILPRQHFLLCYLTTLSVGPAGGIWTGELPHLADRHLSIELTGQRDTWIIYHMRGINNDWLIDLVMVWLIDNE